MISTSGKQARSLVFTRLLPVAIAVALLASCAGMQIKPPDLFLQNIKVKEIGVGGMQLDVKLDLTNGNVQPITLQFFEYTLSLNGHKIGKGYFRESLDYLFFHKNEARHLAFWIGNRCLGDCILFIFQAKGRDLIQWYQIKGLEILRPERQVVRK